MNGSIFFLQFFDTTVRSFASSARLSGGRPLLQYRSQAPAMGVELVPTPKAPKNWSLAIRLTAKIHQLCMLLFGRSNRALKTLNMESSLKRQLKKALLTSPLKCS